MKKLCALLRIKLFFQQDDTKIVNPLAEDLYNMAYYSLEDVAKLISFWHQSKQYEIVPCMFIFVHYKFCLFESIQLCEENGVSHVSFWHTKVDLWPPKIKPKKYSLQAISVWGSSA